MRLSRRDNHHIMLFIAVADPFSDQQIIFRVLKIPFTDKKSFSQLYFFGIAVVLDNSLIFVR